MKKLIFSLFLTLSVFVSMEAQVLNVQGLNNTNDTWKISLTDASGDVAVPALGSVTPGAFNTTITNFNLGLTWIATNLATGCATGGTIPAPVGNTTLTLLCSGPSPQVSET